MIFDVYQVTFYKLVLFIFFFCVYMDVQKLIQ